MVLLFMYYSQEVVILNLQIPRSSKSFPSFPLFPNIPSNMSSRLHYRQHLELDDSETCSENKQLSNIISARVANDGDINASHLDFSTTEVQIINVNRIPDIKKLV